MLRAWTRAAERFHCGPASSIGSPFQLARRIEEHGRMGVGGREASGMIADETAFDAWKSASPRSQARRCSVLNGLSVRPAARARQNGSGASAGASHAGRPSARRCVAKPDRPSHRPIRSCRMDGAGSPARGVRHRRDVKTPGGHADADVMASRRGDAPCQVAARRRLFRRKDVRAWPPRSRPRAPRASDRPHWRSGPPAGPPRQPLAPGWPRRCARP